MRSISLCVMAVLLSACATTLPESERPVSLPADEPAAAVKVVWFHFMQAWTDPPLGRLVPAVDGDRIYVADGAGYLHAYTIEGG